MAHMKRTTQLLIRCPRYEYRNKSNNGKLFLSTSIQHKKQTPNEKETEKNGPSFAGFYVVVTKVIEQMYIDLNHSK